MAHMTSAVIDSAILAVAQTSWRKVAMVIAKAAERLGPTLPAGDFGYEMIAQRVEALVKVGRLASQGELSRWRYSEVRLP
jgi:hypothetical protein